MEKNIIQDVLNEGSLCREEEGGGWEDTGAKSSNYPRDWVNILRRPGSKGPMRAGSSEKKEAL